MQDDPRDENKPLIRLDIRNLKLSKKINYVPFFLLFAIIIPALINWIAVLP